MEKERRPSLNFYQKPESRPQSRRIAFLSAKKYIEFNVFLHTDMNMALT
jgi:hypothetical protein